MKTYLLLLLLFCAGMLPAQESISQPESNAHPQWVLSPFYGGNLSLAQGYGLGLSLRYGRHELGLFHNMEDRDYRGAGAFYHFFPFKEEQALQAFVGIRALGRRNALGYGGFTNEGAVDLYQAGLEIGTEIRLLRALHLSFSAGQGIAGVHYLTDPSRYYAPYLQPFASLGLKVPIGLSPAPPEKPQSNISPDKAPLFISLRNRIDPYRLVYKTYESGISQQIEVGSYLKPWIGLFAALECGPKSKNPRWEDNSRDYFFQGLGGGLRLQSFQQNTWYNYFGISYFRRRWSGADYYSGDLRLSSSFGKRLGKHFALEMGGDLSLSVFEDFHLQTGLVFIPFR